MAYPEVRYERMPVIMQTEFESDQANLAEDVEQYGSIESSADLQIKTNRASRWGTRHTFVLLSFLGFANIYAMRVNLSVAIVAMVSSSDRKNDTNIGTQCPIPNTTHDDPDIGGGDFDWNSKEQGLILGSFFYGYVVTQIPGGFLSEKYGGKWFYGLGTLCTAILTLLTPLAAKIGVWCFVLCRILEGLGEGMTYPAMHAMMSRWVPLNERSKFVTLISSGAQFGTVISMPISGLMAAKIGWQSVFYFFGALGCVWFVFWAFLVFNTPQNHPRITSDELHYIETNIIRTASDGLPFPPIKAIFSTAAFWALIIAHCGQNWGFYTLLTEIPTYLKNIQHFSLTGNGFISALPYLCMSILCIPFSILADWLISTQRLSLGATRKLMQTIGQITPAVGLLGLSFVGCNSDLAVLMLVLSVGFNGASYSGYQGNHMELSPNYAGTLMGITNMIGNFAGFITPYVAGVLVNYNQTLEAWRNVFLISSSSYILCNLIFVLFGSSKLQKWNTYWEHENNR